MSYLRRIAVGTAAAAATIGLGAGAAFASHQFTDVPTSSPWHSSVDFISDRGITGGCGGGNYCPTANVTRGQMSAFLQRSASVLTPEIHSRAETTILPPTANMCEVDDYEPVSYERQATISITSVMNNTGASTVPQAGSGFLWSYGDNTFRQSPLVFGNGGAALPPGELGIDSDIAVLDLEPGLDYTFVVGTTGLPTSGYWRCQMIVEITNRMPGNSSLPPTGSAPESTPAQLTVVGSAD